jgi:PAS domain S-box-containing protein
MFGYDRAELLGRGVEMLLPERYRQAHTSHRLRYGADPQVRSMGAGLELLGRRHDGSEFPVEISLSPIADRDGHAVVASIRDVTDRVAADAHRKRIQAAINATHDGVYVFSADTFRFLYVNDGGVVQTGYSSAELLEMTPMHVAPEFTREGVTALIEPLLDRSVPQVEFRTALRPRNGVEVPIDVVLDCPSILGEEGERLIVAVVRDVSSLVATARKLVESEMAFRLAFDDAPVGMFLVDLDDRGGRSVVKANDAFGELLGRTARELVGLDIVEITHPDDRDQTKSSNSELASGRVASYSVEKRYLHANGSAVWAQLHAKTLVRAEKLLVLAHVADIRHRKAMEAEQRSRQLASEGVVAVRESLDHPDFDDPDRVKERHKLICSHALSISGASWAAVGRMEDGELVWLASEGSDLGSIIEELCTVDIPSFDGDRAREVEVGRAPGKTTVLVPATGASCSSKGANRSIPKRSVFSSRLRSRLPLRSTRRGTVAIASD